MKEEKFGQLDAWNELWVREGSWLIWRRKNLLKDFERVATEHHRLLNPKEERLKLLYKTRCEGESREEIETTLAKKLGEHEQHERILKTTLSGPHRDDYEISIDEQPIRNFGSEGQKRSAMLSLRMAQWKCLGDRSGELPMILLDDVLGELDEHRRTAFLDLVMQSGAQIFLALTQVGEPLRDAANAVFRVCNGTLERIDATRVSRA